MIELLDKEAFPSVKKYFPIKLLKLFVYARKAPNLIKDKCQHLPNSCAQFIYLVSLCSLCSSLEIPVIEAPASLGSGP